MQPPLLVQIDWVIISFAVINFLLMFIINLFTTMIEASFMKKLGYGTWFNCLGMAFFMNTVSTVCGYIMFLLSTIKDFPNTLAYFPGAFIAELINPQFESWDGKVLAILSVWFCVATALELMILIVFRREHSLNRIGKMVLMANFFSSLILFGLIGLAKLSVGE